MHLTPKEYIVRQLGGVRSTAKLLKIDPGSVSRWDKLVPQRYHVKILKLAKKKKIDIEPTDIILGRKI